MTDLHSSLYSSMESGTWLEESRDDGSSGVGSSGDLLEEAQCDVCGTFSRSFLCKKCGSKRKRAVASKQRPGMMKRESTMPSATIEAPLSDLNVLLRNKTLSLPLAKTRASKLDPKSPGPTPKIPLTAIASESRGLKSLPVPVEAAAQGLEKMVLQLVTRVQMLEDMLQSEVRERYRLELVVQRLSEDGMRARGIDVTSKDMGDFVYHRSHFLENVPEAFKTDYDNLDFGDELGSGGFSIVYAGTYGGHPVAIKKIRVELFAAPTDSEGADLYLDEVEKEVSLLSELRHPNIMQLVGVCVWPSHFIVTELMKDGDFSGLLRRRLRFSWTERLSILKQAAQGLHYLHHLRPCVVHLDLKPENVLCSFNPDGIRAVLSDFGLSVKKQTIVAGSTAERQLKFKLFSQVTQSGSLPTFAPAMRHVVGTQYHIAPEICLHLPFNERADIYSFGMLVWSAITRRHVHKPHHGEESLEIVWQPDIPPEVPGEIREFITSCWKEAPLSRPDISIVSSKLVSFESLPFDPKNDTLL